MTLSKVEKYNKQVNFLVERIGFRGMTAIMMSNRIDEALSDEYNEDFSKKKIKEFLDVPENNAGVLILTSFLKNINKGMEMAIIPMYQEDYYKIYPEDKPKNIKRNKLKSSR